MLHLQLFMVLVVQMVCNFGYYKASKTDKLSVTYNGYVQTKAAAKTLNPLSAQDYVEVIST